MTLQVTDQAARQSSARVALSEAWNDLKEKATRGVELVEAGTQLHDQRLVIIPRITAQFEELIKLDDQAGKILNYNQRTILELIVSGLKSYHFLSELEGTRVPGPKFSGALQLQLGSLAKEIIAPLLRSFISESPKFRVGA